MLTESSQLFIDKFNICIARYIYYINELDKELLIHLEDNVAILEELNRRLESEEENVKLLDFVIDKLKKFSKLYDVDIENIDDFKITYFIALSFIEDQFFTDDKSKKIILVVLHRIMCSSLLAYEPNIILDKLKLFIQRNSYQKFYEEYGDIGYYHTIKSIYLMQEISAKTLINEEELNNQSTVISNYFKRINSYE